jgi:hypothetical protein
LVLGRWLGLFDAGTWWGVPDVVAFPKLLGLICGVGVFLCFYAVARALTSRPAVVTVAAGVGLACVPSWVIWVVSGLENGLLAVTVAGLAAVLARAAAAGRLLELGPAVGCGLLAALAALTRPDGLIYAGAYSLVVVVLLRRERLVRALVAMAASFAAFAVPVGIYLVWRVVTFGEVLPNTALAKSQGAPGLEAVHRPVELVAYLGVLAVLLVAGVVAAALAQSWPGRDGLLALLVTLGLAVVAFAVLVPDWMGEFRFATGVWTLLALVAAVAAARVWSMLAPRGRILAAAVALVALASSSAQLLDTARMFRAAPTAPMCLVAANAGHNIAGYADLLGVEQATVLVPDIGGAALVSPVRIIDLAGLTDATMAGFWHAGDFDGMRDYVFDAVRPTLIKAHGPWLSATGLADDPRLAAHYEIIGSTSGTTDWVRSDLVDEHRLAALRDYHANIAAPRDVEARSAPRGSC